MVHGLWTWLVSCNCAGSTCWISTWRFNNHAAWLGTWQFLCKMVRMFGCTFTFHIVWLDCWQWRRICCWIITGTSTWMSSWISKSWSYAWFFVWISHWHDTWHVSWKSSWIPTWLYLEYQLVWSLAWLLEIPLAIQLDPLFFPQLTWHLNHWLACWWGFYLEIISAGLLRHFYYFLDDFIWFACRSLVWLWFLV